MKQRFIGRHKGGVSRNLSTIEEPLEREIARMKRERMPIPGGASRVYMEEEEGNDWCDFHNGILDLARKAASRKEAGMVATMRQPGIESKGESEGATADAQQ